MFYENQTTDFLRTTLVGCVCQNHLILLCGILTFLFDPERPFWIHAWRTSDQEERNIFLIFGIIILRFESYLKKKVSFFEDNNKKICSRFSDVESGKARALRAIHCRQPIFRKSASRAKWYFKRLSLKESNYLIVIRNIIFLNFD